jgi:hypothetical protein
VKWAKVLQLSFRSDYKGKRVQVIKKWSIVRNFKKIKCRLDSYPFHEKIAWRQIFIMKYLSDIYYQGTSQNHFWLEIHSRITSRIIWITCGIRPLINNLIKNIKKYYYLDQRENTHCQIIIVWCQRSLNKYS